MANGQEWKLSLIERTLRMESILQSLALQANTAIQSPRVPPIPRKRRIKEFTYQVVITEISMKQTTECYPQTPL